MKPDSEENRTDVEEPPRECLKHIARLSQKQTPLLWVSQAWEWLFVMLSLTTLGALVFSEGAPAVYTILSFPKVMVLDNQLMCTN